MIQNEPQHCAICNVVLTEYEPFYWWPMCDMHRTKARGLHEWIQKLCNRAYSHEEAVDLGQEIVRFMRLEQEEIR